MTLQSFTGSNWEIQLTNFQGLFFTLYSSLKSKTLNILEIDVAELVTLFVQCVKTLSLNDSQFAFIDTYLLMVVELLELKSRFLNRNFRKQVISRIKSLSLNDLLLLQAEHQQNLKTLKVFATISKKTLDVPTNFKNILPRKQLLPRGSIWDFPKVLTQLFVNPKKSRPTLRIKATSLNLFLKSKWVLKTLKVHSNFNIFSFNENKKEVVAVFLVSLDLAKNGKLFMSQDTQFGKIKVASIDGHTD